MYLEDINKKNPIKIGVDLELLKNKYLLGEDFCLYLSINIVINSEEKKYENILIDKKSIERLIKCIKEFSESEDEEFYYEPLEGSFWIYVPKPLLTKGEICKDLIAKGMPKNYIEELNSDYTYKLFCLVNTYKCGTGISYCLNITKKMLEEFSNELQRKYSDIISSSTSSL